ncbi:unnamed protein product [Rotaria sp. Silwood2]|nr:unnamed protein product [Rotaria sp. Silwood2]CAF3055801.1 unnamed protein product [Rotaria sp. Silwood2]CAF3500296.1 unnamed protein product [Rotaria sp. Silwood2]CAF3928568.1 unnamed protein product [Rotaria sp. Silwood2]CAF3959650.1 unnamed protein product [Rotaria sp. Silwood2]
MLYAEFRRQQEESISRKCQLIDQNKNNPQPYFVRGCARKHLTQYQLAVNDFSIGIQINDKHSLSYYKRCLTYLAFGHYNQALQDADKYVELCPFKDGHIAYFNRAVYHMKMPCFEKAYNDFTKAIQFEPNDLFYQCCRARVAPKQNRCKTSKQSNMQRTSTSY